MAYWTVSGGCPAVGDEVEVKCHAEGAPAVALAARIGAEAGAVFVAWGGGGGGGTACGSVPSPVLRVLVVPALPSTPVNFPSTPE
ncbi:hypothetical protein DIPPA_31003 [Diplonema papillatum]|nr:hypothetical protein DIPPA_31003 [Diplonema papillatum]